MWVVSLEMPLFRKCRVIAIAGQLRLFHSLDHTVILRHKTKYILPKLFYIYLPKNTQSKKEKNWNVLIAGW